MLDVGEYFWLLLVAATEREAGYVQIFHQLAAAIATKNHNPTNHSPTCCESAFVVNSKPVTHKCCCGSISPKEEPSNGTKILLAGLRATMEHQGVRTLVERLGLETLGDAPVLIRSAEEAAQIDKAMILFKDSQRQTPPEHLFIVPPGVTAIF